MRIGWMMAALLICAGCRTTTFQTGLQGGGAQHEEKAHFFLWGLAGEKVVDLDSVCPRGAARFSNQQTFTDGFLSILTLGIYSPRTVTVECAGSVGLIHLEDLGDGKHYRVVAQR